MKFHSLIAAALLLLAFDTGATLLHTDLPAAATAAPAEDTERTYVYQNGDLVLDIRDTAGAEILQAGLSYFFHDEHIATANELPAAAAVEPIQVVEHLAAPDDSAQDLAGTLPEPFSLGLLGAGIAVLGWTRRQGSWVEKLKRKLHLFEVLPWPGLCWLD